MPFPTFGQPTLPLLDSLLRHPCTEVHAVVVRLDWEQGSSLLIHIQAE